MRSVCTPACASFLRVVSIAMSLSSLATLSVSAQERYLLGPGDSLLISFLSNSDLNRAMQVGTDGNVFMPLIGSVNVQGQAIEEVREQVPFLMAGAVYRERINGEYLLVTVEPNEVIIEVDQYRPIYVDGAVRSPGQQAFEIGISVRQAVAAAEGLSEEEAITRGDAAVRNHPEVLMADLIGVLAEIALQEAILADATTIDTAALEALDAPPEMIRSAIERARSQVATSSEILREELAFLNTSVLEAEARVMASLRHEEAMTEIAETEEEEVARIEVLVARRIVSSESLTQSRRLFLQAVERLGNVQGSRLAAEADRRGLVLERNQAVRERALAVQARLQELSQQAAQLRVRIQLSAPQTSTLQLDQVAIGAPHIVIFRQSGGQASEFEAMPETLLLPGDVVSVTLSE